MKRILAEKNTQEQLGVSYDGGLPEALPPSTAVRQPERHRSLPEWKSKSIATMS
jgi:hypothetical protein